jgi:hypothetical protein
MTDPLLPTRLSLAFTAEGRAKAAKLIKDRHTCTHCNEQRDENLHGGHGGLCCDCFDLSWFPESLDKLNQERAARGKPPMPAWGKR